MIYVVRDKINRTNHTKEENTHNKILITPKSTPSKPNLPGPPAPRLDPKFLLHLKAHLTACKILNLIRIPPIAF